MSQEMIIRECATEVALRDVQNMQKMCAELMKTKHYQALGEPGIFAILQKSRALGIDPLEALNGGLYYVQGKVGMSSEMMSSLIRSRGHSITKDKKSNNQICILHGKRADNGDEWTVEFTMEDAKRAGLAKMMYEKFPGIMLYNRAMSMLARQLFSDVIKGAGYTREELMEIKPAVTMSEPQDIELISEEQVKILESIFEKCDPDYVLTVKAFMQRSLGSDDFKVLPLHLYDRVKTAAEKNSQNYYKAQSGGDFEEAVS